MALIISAGAAMILGQLGEMMTDLNERDIPRLTASLGLSSKSESLAGQGPSLMASDSAEMLEERGRNMRLTQQILLQKLLEIVELGAEESITSPLRETVKNIDEMITSLRAAAKERLDTASEHENLNNNLRKVHANFVAVSDRVLRDAQAKVEAAINNRPSQEDIATPAQAARAVKQLGDVVTSTNLLFMDMAAALSTTNGDALDAIEKAVRVKQKRVISELEVLTTNTDVMRLTEAAMKLLALAEGKASVLQVRQKELDSNDYARIILDEFRKLNIGLGTGVNQLVEGVRAETNSSVQRARQGSALATLIMLVLGSVTLAGSVLFVWLYVGRNILRRIGHLQRSMQLLSDGDLETEIPVSRRWDEIASMANSLEIFRESMIEARVLSANQDTDRIAKAERATRMETQIVAFEDLVRTALEGLMGSANTLQLTAESMSVSADRSSALATAVASAAEETSVNVHTVS